MIAVFLASARLHIANEWSNPAGILLGVVQPLILTTILLLGGHLSGSEGLANATAVALCSLWGLTVWSGGNILRTEVWSGTIGRLVVAPGDIRVVIIGKSAGSAALSVAVTTTSVSLVAWFGGIHFGAANTPLVVLGIACSLASAVGLGLMLGSLFVLTRAASRIAEVLMYPVLVFGGLILPLSFLPDWLQWPSALISLRWTRELVATGLTGGANAETLGAMMAAMVLTASYFVAGWVLFGRVLRHVRLGGSLEFA